MAAAVTAAVVGTATAMGTAMAVSMAAITAAVTTVAVMMGSGDCSGVGRVDGGSSNAERRHWQ